MCRIDVAGGGVGRKGCPGMIGAGHQVWGCEVVGWGDGC